MHQEPFVGQAPTEPAGGAHSFPKPLSWTGGRPQRAVQEEGKQKRDEGREEGISGKEGEGTEGRKRMVGERRAEKGVK